MGREVGGRFKREGTYVCLWLIHADIWQRPTQYCKPIILQLKINLKIKTVNKSNHTHTHTHTNLRHSWTREAQGCFFSDRVSGA